MTPTPDFEELIGADLSPEEQARLRRAHDLLIAVGPPPELPPALAEAGAVEAEPTPLFTKIDEKLGETGPEWAPIER